MCLVLFGWLSTMPFFKELVNVNTRDQLYNKQMQSISQNLTPFIMHKATDEPKGEVIGGDYWITSEWQDTLRENGFKY